MAQGRTGLNGSAIGFISALSPLNVEGAGSTNPFDMSQYEWMNVIVATASNDLVVNVMRASASNGSFSQVGLSIPGNASGLSVRGMKLGSSAFFYKASYSMEPNASAITSIVFEAHPARRTPIKQDSNTDVYSDIL